MSRKLSNGGTYYGPDWLYHIGEAFNNTEEWLYGEWDRQKYEVYSGLRAVPVFNDYMDYLLDRRFDSEYLRRYNMDYSDINDPRKLSSSGSLSRLVGSSYRMFSRNIDRLYR